MDHHIISQQFAKDYAEMLGKLDFNIFTSRENVIPLPKTAQDALDLMRAEGLQHVSSHPGGHLKTYYRVVEDQLSLRCSQTIVADYDGQRERANGVAF